MTDIKQQIAQFGSAKPLKAGSPETCAQCEAMLADRLDGTLSPEDAVHFAAHVAVCAACEQMLADAQRGAAWLEMLRSSPPVPPAGLLERILAQTSRATAGPDSEMMLHASPALVAPISNFVPTSVEAAPAASLARVIPFPRRAMGAFRSLPLGGAMLQPRLAMTAAMAFFSIGLTLNLTGVQLNQLHANDLKPSSLRRNFYQANAHVVRYVENLRTVYELESRVRDLQRASDGDRGEAPPAESEKPADGSRKAPGTDKQPRPRTGSGTSRRNELSDPHSEVIWRADATSNRIFPHAATAFSRKGEDV